MEVGYDSRSAALMAVTRDIFTSPSALMPIYNAPGNSTGNHRTSKPISPRYLCTTTLSFSSPSWPRLQLRWDAYPIFVVEIGYRN